VIRIVLLLLVLWLGYRLLSELMARVRAEIEQGSGVPQKRGESPPSERLVPCRVCGVHVAESSALRLSAGGEGGEAFVCSPRCRELSRVAG
jgi:hypothetical protein